MWLNDLVVTLPLVFLGVHLAAVPVFVTLLWKWSSKPALGWLILLAVESIAAVLLSVYAGGMFSWGTTLVCLTPLTVAASAVLLLIAGRRFFCAFEGDRLRRRIYVFGGLFAVALQVSVFAGHYGLKSACFAQTRRRAIPIIDATVSYHQDYAIYPRQPDDIVPAYLPSLLLPACQWLRTSSSSRSGFTLERCEPDTILLTAYAVDGEFIRRYNFSTETWSTVSFLDGTCSHLR